MAIFYIMFYPKNTVNDRKQLTDRIIKNIYCNNKCKSVIKCVEKMLNRYSILKQSLTKTSNKYAFVYFRLFYPEILLFVIKL